jgi:hypothetical protein
MKYKRYAKVVTKEFICAIYEPHPFRSGAISEAVGSSVNTGITDDEWIWVYYDWCGSPVCLSDEKPDGIDVDKFTTENLDLSFTTPECAQNLVDYFNKEPYGEENKQC